MFANRPDNWLNLMLNRETNRDYAERLRAEAERAAKEALSWRDLKKKFQRAASRPWEAGPPEPANIQRKSTGKRGQPRFQFNWYEGGLRKRLSSSVSLAIRARRFLYLNRLTLQTGRMRT